MSDAVRKRCVDCKKTWQGSRSRMQWCDNCGGELKTIPYGQKRRARGSKRT